ncbi:MAG: LPS export ABC transporter periplasmic protein LptC [Candidatus Cloacimonetes bacterium]|nr:LPS export ABC transporter periplasmic protein LptC [Candidatus Cloacimonadota bacterium]
MIKSFKNFLHILVIISTLCFTFVSCTNERDSKDEIITNAGPEEYIEGIEVYNLIGKVYDYKLNAEVVKNYYSPKLTIAYKVKLDSYDKEGKHDSYIECDSAYVENDADLIKAYGHVYFETPNGIVKTDYIFWDKPNDKVFAPNRVVLKRGDNEITGYNLRTDSKFRITNMDNVKAKGTVDEKNINL